MPDATPGGVGDALEPTPRATYGFGPREDADTTRQAQHSFSNDSPTDVNMNATVARAQAMAFTNATSNFEANADRRNKIADAFMGKLFDKAST